MATATLAANGSAPAAHQHLLSVLVENHPGVLARISGMFSTRGYNIDSLAVGTTHDPTLSRITLACPGDDRVIGQIIKQLRKMVDVVQVIDLFGQAHVERELMLVKVAATPQTRTEIVKICGEARVADQSDGAALVIEITGPCEQNEALLAKLEPFGILEMTRTGRIALNAGAETLSVPE